MARVGVITPPVPGHINPFVALGRELESRGHQVVFFQMADIGARVREEGFEFHPIGESDHPPGSLARSLEALGKLNGLAALRHTIQAVTRTTEMICRDAPGAISRARVDLMLVDQTEPAGGSVAEHLKIPFVTICNALALNREPQIPPPFTSWVYRRGVLGRLRNRIGYFAADVLTRPIQQVLERHRRDWGLPILWPPDRYSSQLAQISQLVPGFEYPRASLPPQFQFVGPLRSAARSPVEFPWGRLREDRPLIYASLGTLQGSKEVIFRCFAAACGPLRVQLVISHGFGLNPEQAASLAKNALVVPYAPQVELLRKASATITHGGLNTVLDTLSAGVPAVAVPVTFEQPGIGRRLEYCGAGKMIPMRALSARRLRWALEEILSDNKFRRSAQAMATAIAAAGGVSRAADIIEKAGGIRTNPSAKARSV